MPHITAHRDYMQRSVSPLVHPTALRSNPSGGAGDSFTAFMASVPIRICIGGGGGGGCRRQFFRAVSSQHLLELKGVCFKLSHQCFTCFWVICCFLKLIEVLILRTFFFPTC